MLKKGKSDKGATKKKGKGGVSLDDDDAIDVGLFSSGPAVIKESIFANYDYGGNAKEAPVWLLTYGRDGEEDYEQPYSIGKGWKISEDGKTLIAKAGQTGLPKSCNAIRHLIKPLKAALADSDVEIDLSSGDPSVLDGLEVVLRRVDQEVRDIRDKGKQRRDRDESKGPRTILEIEEVTGSDGDTSASTVKKKKKKKPEPEDDDADDDQDDDADDDQDDDDDDDAPAKKKGKGKEKPTAKGKGKSKSDDDDDDDDDDAGDDDDSDDSDDDGDDDDDPREEAIEALIEVASAGPVPLAKLEAKLAKFLKGNKKAPAIIEWATSTKNLKLKKGWDFDGKTISVESDDDDD